MHRRRAAFVVTILCLLSAWAEAQRGGGGAGGIGGNGGNGGGFGGGGVAIDPKGVLYALKTKTTSKTVVPKLDPQLAQASNRRLLSLRAIEQAIKESEGRRETLPDDLYYLAGLVKVDTVQVEKDDVLIGGAAEGWSFVNGRALGVKSKRPVLTVDDLIVALRCVYRGNGAVYCSIEPRPEGLVRVQKVMARMLDVKTRDRLDPYVDEVSAAIDRQDIITRGAPAGSRFALTMIAADYLMKRMAVGLEKHAGLSNHLDAIFADTRHNRTNNHLARWWFSPNYDRLLCNEEQTVFVIEGQGMQLQNEEMFVDAAGKRTGAGRKAENDRFAALFTKMLPKLEHDYPLFADLHNLFDVTMLAGLIKERNLAPWLRGSSLLDPQQYEVEKWPQPTSAEPVVAAKMQGNRGPMAVAFGGVTLAPAQVLATIKVETTDMPMDRPAPTVVVSNADSAKVEALKPTSEPEPARPTPVPSPKSFWRDSGK